jgi:DHA2 family multidrug resistance protein-like MFS transporter
MPDNLDTHQDGDVDVDPGSPAGRREWLGLAVLALPALLLSLDLSVLSLALPRLSSDLHASSVQQLWITDIYGFMVSGFLITMGRLGDRVGRRRLLLVGAAAFAAASVLAAFSGSPQMLIGARALMGIAGATLAPSTLALITNMFRDPKQRTVGIAVYVSCFMGGTAFGPVIGGLLLQWFWWGSVFLVGVPVMALLLVAGPMLLPEYRDENAGRIDLVSVVLSLLTILPAVYGIKELARSGVGAVPLLAIVVGLVAGAAFIGRQRRLSDPLLNLDLFRSRAFSVALVVLMFAVATQGGVMLLVNLHLQVVQGLTPLSAGLWGMAPALGMVAGSMAAPALAQRTQPGLVIAGGLGIAAVGYLLMTLVGVSGLVMLIAAATVVFFGIGLVGALANDQVVGSVEPAKAGSAASIAQTSGDLGIALGIAVLGSIGTAFYAGRLHGASVAGVPQTAVEAARTSITDATAAAANLNGSAGQHLFDAAQSAFTDGLHLTAVVSAVLVAALSGLALWGLRRSAPAESEPETERTPARAAN